MSKAKISPVSVFVSSPALASIVFLNESQMTNPSFSQGSQARAERRVMKTIEYFYTGALLFELAGRHGLKGHK